MTVADFEEAKRKAHAEMETGKNGPMPPASTVKPKRVAWLWFPRLPLSMITILGAKGGSCKGLTCAHIAAIITTGGLWPDGTGPAPQGNILWCEAEDPLAEVVVPRLIAAGADRTKVFCADRKAFADEQNLRGYIERNGIRLIVLSPMLSFLQLADINGELGVREVLQDLQASIEALPCAIIGICHTNKKPDLAAIERILGAVAFTNFVRCVLLSTLEDPDEGTYRILHAKHNLSTKADDFIIRPVYVGDDPLRRDQYVKLVWSPPEDGNTQTDAAFDRKKPGDKPSASQWLRTYLRKNGETERDTVIVAAAAAGHTEDALKKVHARSPDVFQSRRETFPNRAWWSLR